MVTQWLTRPVVSDAAVARVVQAGCFGAAGLIPWLAFRKFAELELSASDLMVGVLATLAVAVFFTGLGLLLEFKARAVKAPAP